MDNEKKIENERTEEQPDEQLKEQPKEQPSAPPADERPEYSGRNLEEAISLAEHRLKLPREKFDYEIVTEKTRLFGLKGKEIVIRAWAKDEGADNAVERFLNKLMTVFPLELTFQIKKRPDIIFVVFDGPDKTMLLRNDGSLLLAIQHMLNKISPIKVQADCEFYRKRKEKKLKEYGQRVARQVSDSGREEILDLMNPYERRIIHIVANETPGDTSESIGDAFLKKVKIFKAPR
ncbi:MAG: Jag N-terminal domain-containing protein [Candidatus Aminicenantes bacterium]|nr:Jag N-terminal domain-containing protein [Candidatus Aminicenantes bacterium]